MSKTVVDSGALMMAINVLRRNGKSEVADELLSTAVRTNGGWIDVELAPKDGSAIDLLAETFRLPDCGWNEDKWVCEWYTGGTIPPELYARITHFKYIR